MATKEVVFVIRCDAKCPKLLTKPILTQPTSCWEDQTAFCPSKRKGEILTVSTEGILCSWKKGTCRAKACPEFHNTFRQFPVIMSHLEISPYPPKVLRQHVYLPVTFHLGSRNPKCSLNVMERNSSLNREEESILLEEHEACCACPFSSGTQGSPSNSIPQAGDVKKLPDCTVWSTRRIFTW